MARSPPSLPTNPPPRISEPPPVSRSKTQLTARDPTRVEEYTARWTLLPQAGRDEIKQKKVLSTLGSQEHRAGTAAAQVIAAIAAIELPVGLWNELIAQLLGAMGDASNMRLRQAALQAIGFNCEGISSDVLAAQSNEILTAVIQGARKRSPRPRSSSPPSRRSTTRSNSSAPTLSAEGERNYIMQVVCEATQSPNIAVKIAAYECLVRTMQLYYDKMRFYMEQALFGLTVLGMRDSEPKVALQAVEFWSTVCDEEIELALEAEEAAEFGEDPERACYNFARIALRDRARAARAAQDPGRGCRRGRVGVSKAAGTCVGLLARWSAMTSCDLPCPSSSGNIKNPDWHAREAAVMCFRLHHGRPRPQDAGALVESRCPPSSRCSATEHRRQGHTAAWTLGASRISAATRSRPTSTSRRSYRRSCWAFRTSHAS